MAMKKIILLIATVYVVADVSDNRELTQTSQKFTLIKRDEVVQDFQGKQYNLKDTKPYSDIFSPAHFLVSDDGATVVDIATNESFPASIYRAQYDDKSTLQVIKDEYGDTSYVEIRHLNGTADAFFIRDENIGTSTSGGTFSRLSLDDLNTELQKVTFEFADPILPDDTERNTLGPIRNLRDRRLLPPFVYKRGDDSSAECNYFKVVRIAIVYDSEFCALYGSSKAARLRIIAIVSSASLYYENDMCVKLQLTNIYSPDTACQGTSVTFKNFHRSIPCTTSGSSLLGDFTNWMVKNRQAIGIDSSSLVHYMTGYKPGGVLGCAWKATLCKTSYSYGLQYMSFTTQIVAQGTALAHEVGHSLGADHISSSGEYIMEAKLSTGADGFDQGSVSSILAFLNKVTCDGVLLVAASVTSPGLIAKSQPTQEPATSSKNQLIHKMPPTCDVEQFDNDLCIVGGMADMFACFTTNELIESLGSKCLLDAVTVDVLSCDDTFSGRFLKKSMKKKKHNKETNTNRSSTISCTSFCPSAQNKICFLATQGSTHSVTFQVKTKAGFLVTHTTHITVEKHGQSSRSCRPATTKCVD